METNDNKGQLKKLGKIEGVIYVEDTEGAKASGVSVPLQNELPFPEAGLPPQTTGKRMFHKERTQDVLVHCPVSLHKRLKDLKDHIWDEYGERVNINNMVIEAIALWLDQQEGKKSINTNQQ